MIDFYRVPVSQINNIKAGMDWTNSEGETIPHALLTSDPDPQRAYAYCSDTRYMPSLAEKVKGVDLLYHESTYTEEFHDRAEKYLHSTAREAAMTARDANVGKLLLGHFSKRFLDEKPLLDEARAVFPNSFLAKEGLVMDV